MSELKTHISSISTTTGVKRTIKVKKQPSETKQERVNRLFVDQKLRIDILANMLMLANLLHTGRELFDIIMNDNRDGDETRAGRQGWIFETLCQILIVLKCTNIGYTEICHGQLQNLKQVKKIRSLLNVKVEGGGSNIVDMTLKQGTTLVALTIKYREKFGQTDANEIDSTITKQNITDDYKIALVVKDKDKFITHRFKNEKNVEKQILDKIQEDGLLFDEKDIIIALDVFCERFSRNVLSVDRFVEDVIDTECLFSPRQILILKLHQKMTLLKFIKSLSTKHNMWCIAHKPRSGKSITILLMCKYLLGNGYKKILIMTPVPATINSFTDDLETYIDFKDIVYKAQEDFDTIDETFTGIVFCSIQYLKTDKKGVKREMLKKTGFDAIVIDEAHLGASTDKTQTGILDVENDAELEEIRKNVKITIFASGTSEKTRKFYGIHPSHMFEWCREDEGVMKELSKPSIKNRTELVENMVKRHGEVFVECLENETLNRDYSKHPTQVLMKHSIPESLVEDIKTYNTKNGTNFGYSCSSLFALQEIKNSKGEVEYSEDFELCKTIDGREILEDFFDSIVSKKNKMRKTIMKQIETLQTNRGSRKSTIEKPLLFIVYLPTHTRNNTISSLQKTFKKFLETYDLWSEYNVEYSNATEDTGNVAEGYNAFIETIMNKTKKENKKGCILLLGNKGSVGITYPPCDVTISLDDGHNLDAQEQRFSRALTEGEGKTIGINVDMNIQRSYLYLIDMIQKHRRNTKTTKTNAEILYYMFEHNIFLFDPQQINNGNMTTIDIMSYYEKEAQNILLEIDDTHLLDEIECKDEMRDYINTDFQTTQQKNINNDLEGEQQDCPKGDKTKVQVDAPFDTNVVKEKEDDDVEKKEDDVNVTILFNQTREMCKSFLFPLLALISRSSNLGFKEIFTNEKTKSLLMSLLKDKKIELNNDNYSILVHIMNNIIDDNSDIVNSIREIYSKAPASKLRHLIEKHFIPTNDEKKTNAEVPTPVKLVDDMLNTIPLEFWKKPRKVFEPCCGKGNFVLGIFDRYFKGLETTYPDEIERSQVIMTECIYYADLTALNVFITTEIMKCHVQSYCGVEDLEYQFNSYIGDTLELNFEDRWNIPLTMVHTIGNPPYSSDPSKPDTKPLYNKFINKYIPCETLLFVVPSRWFVGGKGLDVFRDSMLKRKDIKFIQHEENSKKWFGNNVDIEGGVNYFMKDSSHNGLCLFNGEPYDLSKYECLVKPKHHTIIDKVKNEVSISSLYMGRHFGIETNDKRFTENGKIKCFVSLQKSKDRCKLIDYDLNEKNTFWKVITAEANGKSPCFGFKTIGTPQEVHTGSYISFRVKDEKEAKSLLSYLETKFANHMLSVRKISQHINGDVCKWIPLVPLDRTWTDDQVCKHLKIDQNMYM